MSWGRGSEVPFDRNSQVSDNEESLGDFVEMLEVQVHTWSLKPYPVRMLGSSGHLCAVNRCGTAKDSDASISNETRASSQYVLL